MVHYYRHNDLQCLCETFVDTILVSTVNFFEDFLQVFIYTLQNQKKQKSLVKEFVLPNKL